MSTGRVEGVEYTRDDCSALDMYMAASQVASQATGAVDVCNADIAMYLSSTSICAHARLYAAL